MEHNQPPGRPKRRAVCVYLVDDELACLDRASKALGMKRGPFIRRAALFRAGWQGYSGPLFEGRCPIEPIEQAQLADVLHQALLTLREIAATISAIYNSANAKPSGDLIRMLSSQARIVTNFQQHLPSVQKFDDVLEVTLDLEALGPRVQHHHKIAGDQLMEAAEHTRRALQTGVGHGETEQGAAC